MVMILAFLSNLKIQFQHLLCLKVGPAIEE